MNFHAYIFFWVFLLFWFIHDIAYGDINDEFIDFVVCSKSGQHLLDGEVIYVRKAAVLGVSDDYGAVKQEDCTTVTVTGGKKFYVDGTVKDVLKRLSSPPLTRDEVEGND